MNRVGVDLNTASASLRIRVGHHAHHREEHRGLPRGERGVHRSQAAEEGGEAGPKAYLNCAGFLRITTERTPRRDERPSRKATRGDRGAQTGGRPRGGGGWRHPETSQRAWERAELAASWAAAIPLRDIMAELEKPGRDPPRRCTRGGVQPLGAIP